MRVRVRVLAAGVMVVALAGLTSCSEEPDVRVPQSSYAPRTATPSSTPLPSTPERNDLARLPLKRSLDAGPLTVNVEYTSRLAIADWQPNVSKPLEVRLTATNKRRPNQKIYLTKVTANVTAYDNGGPVDSPRALVDTTSITPGFIVTTPNTYNQTFSIPAVDDSSIRMTIDFTYELAQEVERNKQGRDFAKQVATDSIAVPIAL